MSYPPGGSPTPYNYSPPPPPPRRSSVWPWILGIGCGVPVLLFAGCTALGLVTANRLRNDPEFREKMGQMSGMATNTAAQKVELVPGTVKVVKDAGSGITYVTGAIRNKTDETIPYLHVKVVCLDKGGVEVGTALDANSNLAPKGVWKFRAVAPNGNTATAKVLEISNSPLDALRGKDEPESARDAPK